MRVPPPAPSRVRRRFLRRFARARRGSTAVEFAMVALPFIFMMFAVIEVGMVFIVDSVLENAVIESGRLIRTGQAQGQGMTTTGFASAVCSRMSIFSSQCASRIHIDVRVLPKFGDQTPPVPTATTFPSSYDQGTAGSIVLVRAWYNQPLITPFMSQGLSKFGDNTTLLTATTAFKNEPFT